jgi:hypothetical protein
MSNTLETAVTLATPVAERHILALSANLVEALGEAMTPFDIPRTNADIVAQAVFLLENGHDLTEASLRATQVALKKLDDHHKVVHAASIYDQDGLVPHAGIDMLRHLRSMFAEMAANGCGPSADAYASTEAKARAEELLEQLKKLELDAEEASSFTARLTEDLLAAMEQIEAPKPKGPPPFYGVTICRPGETMVVLIGNGGRARKCRLDAVQELRKGFHSVRIKGFRRPLILDYAGEPWAWANELSRVAL